MNKSLYEGRRRHKTMVVKTLCSFNLFSSPPPIPSAVISSRTYAPIPIPIPSRNPGRGKQKLKEEDDVCPGDAEQCEGEAVPATSHNRSNHQNNTSEPANSRASTRPKEGISIRSNGVSYTLGGAPFEFQFSYSETPKEKPLAVRESVYVPFAPAPTPTPWIGRIPRTVAKPKKKRVRMSPSFKLPAAGLNLAGHGPKDENNRDRILGEPLSDKEVDELVESCCHINRQVNLGRDGVTHNMLELIHTHWKRRCVCKIKCKGIPTIDMDNICYHIEEKTGGKIIHRVGGVLYLFRGRNYNYKTRPRFPLMLWKPPAPVYPPLVPRAPAGLTIEAADALRRKGRNLPCICKLGKNGVYLNLLKDIREAFEENELVRISCRGMNPTDYKKIGIKLKDLVPCVLLSFHKEHILIWRGNEWKSKCAQEGAPVSAALARECSIDDLGIMSSGETFSSEFGESVPAFNT